MFACFRKPCVNLTANEKARFNNFKKRYAYGITPNQIYNQLKREKEHKYTPSEKGNIHSYMKRVNVMSLNNAHNKTMRLRAISSGKGVFGNASRTYMHNR